MKRYIAAVDVVNEYGISRSKIYRLCRAGKLDWIREGFNVYIEADSLSLTVGPPKDRMPLRRYQVLRRERPVELRVAPEPELDYESDF